MKSILFLIPFFFLYACTEQAQDVEIRQGDCLQYVDLDAANYDSLKTDPINLINAQLVGDCLKLTLQYSGGCEEHQVDLALIHPWCGTPPLPPPTFEIRHNSNEDNCKALVTKDYSFDISGIREQGKSNVDFILYGKNSSGVIASKTYTYSY
ncbi:MAG: NigD-like C-terminal domain-containing protein [Bacteroidota bacterium]|nr:NigD-like C-terminal domain-containing protein [Bacteroidota bacterium]